MLMSSKTIRDRYRVSLALLSLLLTLVTFLTACGDSSATSVVSTSGNAAITPARLSLTKLSYGVINSEDAAKVQENNKLFANALSKELGIPVEVFVGKSYSEVGDALGSGKVNVAHLGPFNYVVASTQNSAEAIALQMGTDGTTFYNSLIITKPDSGINTLVDLKGKRFAFAQPTSTSGNFIPRYIMSNNGLDPDKDIQGNFTGGHDASIDSVISGKNDAVAIASDTYEKYIREGKIKESQLKIIFKSDPISNDPIAVRKDMSANDKAIIKAAFLAVKDPAALKALSIAGFQEASDKDYNILRDIARTLKLDLSKLQ